MSDRKIISVSGKLRHGKDTLAQFILDEVKILNQEDIRHKTTSAMTLGKFPDTKNQIFSTKLAFADPIKKVAKIIFPMLTDDDLWGPSQNRDRVLPEYINPATEEMLAVRNILTQIGAWGRSTNKDCWVNSTFGLIDGIAAGAKPRNRRNLFLISDCRFQNEKTAIENKGGIVIRVIRSSIVNTSTDQSEIDLDGIPLDQYAAVVYNDGDIEHLKTEAKRIVRELLYP